MQSKISFFNKTFFVKNITHYWPIWVGYLLVCLFEIPFATYVGTRNVYSAGLTPETLKAERTYYYVNHMNVLMTSSGFLFCVTIIVAMAMLSYLYNNKSANMIHSLPVRREELFFTNYISGLLFMLVPQIFATLIDVFVCAALGITELQYLMLALIYDMGIIVFFYTFAILVGMLTGQLLALPICYVILNFLEIGMEFIIKMLLSGICYGFSFGNFSLSKLRFLSPVYFLTTSTGINIQHLDDYSYSYEVYGGKYIFYYFLAAILLFVLALLAYKKRRIETAGDLTVFGWLKPIFRWSVTICGALLCGMIFGQIFLDTVSAVQEFFVTLVSVILSGIVCFYIAEMLIEKKFKVFQKKRFIEVGAGAAAAVVILTMIELDAFGVEKKVPELSEVEYALTSDNLLFMDTDEIEELLALHEQIIDEKKEIEAYASDRSNVTYHMSLYYIMKDGSQLTRSYYIPAGREYAEDDTSVIGKVVAMKENPETFMESYFGINYKTNEPKGGCMDIHTIDGTSYYVSDQSSFDEESAKILYDAIEKDAAEGNFHNVILYSTCAEDYMADEVYVSSIDIEFYNKDGIKYPYHILDELRGVYSYWDSSYMKEDSAYVTIGKDCTNTLAALKETGIIPDESVLTTYEELYGQD